jgi:hypothetical protein
MLCRNCCVSVLAKSCQLLEPYAIALNDVLAVRMLLGLFNICSCFQVRCFAVAVWQILKRGTGAMFCQVHVRMRIRSNERGWPKLGPVRCVMYIHCFVCSQRTADCSTVSELWWLLCDVAQEGSGFWSTTAQAAELLCTCILWSGDAVAFPALVASVECMHSAVAFLCAGSTCIEPPQLVAAWLVP